MKFSTVRELKINTRKVLDFVSQGKPVIVTFRGKPKAAIIKISEDEIEDFILEYDPEIRKRIEEGIKDLEEGRKMSFDEFVALRKTEKERSGGKEKR